jgi:class 3 adenylate cyclase/predicted ATPase
MFCDLVDSTPLSERLDPEDLREVLRAYQDMCAAAISRFEGYIARYMGDGLLVYFGYPLAHEDDAQRAVHAGLAILSGLPLLNAQLHRTGGPIGEVSLQTRLGIHTGVVIVGELGGGGDRDPAAIVGETPNIAERVQKIAEPDTVLISAATYRLVQGHFQCLDLGPHRLKGVSAPMPVYRVLSESEAHSRFEVALGKGLTPLVGREQEIGLLRDRWMQAKAGNGQIVLLCGEGGIGKSRLLQELKEQVTGEEQRKLECRCSPYYQNSAFYPLIELLQRILEFKGGDTPSTKLEKIESVLSQYHFSLADTVPLFAGLLSVPFSHRYSPLTLTPQRQKQKTLETMVEWLLKEAEKQVVRFFMEDLQWADSSTLEALSLLIERAPTSRLLMLLTFRPEFHPPWNPRPSLTQIILGRLTAKQAEVMAQQVTGGKILPTEVVQQIVTKTDGVPLFVEELTKMVVESGLLREADGRYELTGPVPPLAIPSTLQDSLLARLDRLATVKEIAQLGATLGREFSYELIQAVASVDEATLQTQLAHLVEAELLYQRETPPQARYTFKHALIQEAAYQLLLKSKRQHYHQQIVQVLTERFPETGQAQPELLAHHCTEAGLKEQAIIYWQKASQKAVERSAHIEAVGHLTKGLTLLKTLPEAADRDSKELGLQLALGASLMASKGFAAPEVEKVYARAWELCQSIGETPQLQPALRGLVAFYVVRSRHKVALEIAAQSLRVAHGTSDPQRRTYDIPGAHAALGVPYFWRGELMVAREHLEQGLENFSALSLEQRRAMAFLYGQDREVVCLSHLALTLWLLGYPDQAVQRSRTVLLSTSALAHPFSTAYALTLAARLHQCRREVPIVQERAEAVIALSTEQGFPLWSVYGNLLRNWALAARGQGEASIGQMRQSLAVYRAMGAELGRSYYLALLAEAYQYAGQPDEAMTAVAEALATADASEEHVYTAELYRLKGELTLQQFQFSSSKFQEAEACFHKAIELARRQNAKSLELRTATSLGRLWRKQDKPKEARQMLAEVYGWFSEGFDTADLREAKLLLEEMS